VGAPTTPAAKKEAELSQSALFCGMNLDEEFERIAAESTVALEPYLRRCVENLYRVGLLVGTAVEPAAGDILRSAVVFLHASMEDCLRSVVAAYLPLAGEETLNRVPLVGTSRRPEKFLLGALLRHRDLIVADIISRSVAEYSRNLTFNSTSEIVAHLDSLGFIVVPRDLLPKLDSMISRRHRIVHRADYDDDGVVSAIKDADVIEWADTVSKFLSSIIAQVGNKEAFIRFDQLLRMIARERGIEL
jgi:HEPN superfamily RiboL-PSP-like protein